MGELGRDWLRGVGVTVPVTGGVGNNQAWPLCWPLVSSKIGGRWGGRGFDHTRRLPHALLLLLVSGLLLLFWRIPNVQS